MKRKLYIITAFVLGGFSIKAQDTTALIKEFNKVMSFSVQPYLYYTTITKMESTPVLQPEDTVTVTGEFFKNGDEMFYSNQQEEMFLQDSLYIQVSNRNKTIWISRVDATTKDKMNTMPLSNNAMQELFRKRYAISKTKLNQQSSRLSFEARQNSTGAAAITVTINLQYTNTKLLPELLEMNINMNQQITEEQVQQLSSQGTDITQLIKTVNSEKYMIRNQRVSVEFNHIDNSKEKAAEMPSWKTRLEYNKAANEFVGKGMYSDYEITKTF